MDPISERKLFIGGVSWGTSDEAFRQFFMQYGDLDSGLVMRDKTGQSRGFGFVTFRSREAAEAVLNSKNLELDGRRLDAHRAVPKDHMGGPSAVREPGAAWSPPTHAQPYVAQAPSVAADRLDHLRVKKMFVGGLAPDATEDELREHFSQYGEVTEVMIMEDRNTGKKRGFAFVSLDSEEGVDQATALRMHNINGKQIEVKKAFPRPSGPPSFQQQPAYHNNRPDMYGYAGGRGGYRDIRDAMPAASGYGPDRFYGGGRGGFGGRGGYRSAPPARQYGYDQREPMGMQPAYQARYDASAANAGMAGVGSVGVPMTSMTNVSGVGMGMAVAPQAATTMYDPTTGAAIQTVQAFDAQGNLYTAPAGTQIVYAQAPGQFATADMTYAYETTSMPVATSYPATAAPAQTYSAQPAAYAQAPITVEAAPQMVSSPAYGGRPGRSDRAYHPYR